MADINDRVAVLEAEVRTMAARFYSLPEVQKLLKAEREEAERIEKAQAKETEAAERAAAKERADVAEEVEGKRPRKRG